MEDKKTIRAEGYLTISPKWSGQKLVGAEIAKVTKTKPLGGTYAVGSAVVKLAIDVPERVFKPFEVEAIVEAQEGDMGVIRIVVEPFTDEEE